MLKNVTHVEHATQQHRHCALGVQALNICLVHEVRDSFWEINMKCVHVAHVLVFQLLQKRLDALAVCAVHDGGGPELQTRAECVDLLVEIEVKR